jgi:tetratricopeptide (TPR) repeat protein
MNEQKELRAIEFIQQGQIKMGMDLLNEEYLKNPNNWSIHHFMGFAWRIIGDMEKAISSYKRAIQLAPNEFANFHSIGIVYQLIGDFDNAIDNFRQAYALNKKAISSLNSLALTYKKKGNLNKALEIYDYAAQTLVHNIHEELRQAGDSSILDHNPLTGEYDEGVGYFNIEFAMLIEERLKQDEIYCRLENNIAVCHTELGNIEEAKKCFLEAIEFTPEGMNYQEPIMGLNNLMANT